MEVKPGYKQTEVGVLPQEWRLLSVEDIGVVSRGRVISHREIAKARIPTYPVYSSQTSNSGVMGYLDTFDFEGEYITWTTDGANAGTVFYRDGRFNCTNVCGTIKVKTDDPRFVARVLSRAAPRHVSRHLGNPKLMNDVMKRVLIPLPPLPEQRAIASALSDVDAVLYGLEQLVAKKRDLKRAAMHQLLTGKTRLSGFEGDWEEKSLGDIASLYQPVTISEKQFAEFGYPVYGANGLVGFYHDFNHDKWQVTVTCRGSTCGTVNKTPNKCWITGNAMVINCDRNPHINKTYLYYLLLSKDLSICITGTGQPQIVRKPLAAFRLILPRDIKEQSAIAAVLSDMDAELSTLEVQRDKTRALKQGMMQELLTGKTRLVPARAGHA